MRKIKITDKLKKEVKTFNSNLFSKTRNSNFELPLDRLKKLKNNIFNTKKQYIKYVDEIINNYSDILNADPYEMKVLIKKFNAILKITLINEKVTSKSIPFHKEVVYAMKYEDLRDKEFPEYLVNSNIKTCVYCNTQYTLSIEKSYYGKKKKKVKEVIAKLQLDHFHPKSKYPFLSTSFFNLYPTCSNCNLAKGSKKSLFELYTNSNQLDVFNFKLDAKSVLDYWVKLDCSKIKVNLETINGNHDLLDNHNQLFQLESIYKTQVDIAEEIIIKHRANPKTYRSILNNQFNIAFPDPNMIDRIIIGNYTLKEEIFKRPLAKYTQDIARELKII